MHWLWRVCRCVRHGDGQAGLRQRLGALFHAKCDGQQMDACANLATHHAPTDSDLHHDFGGSDVRSLGLRTPFKVDVVRDRSTLSRITENGALENVYRLQIMNAAEVARTYHLSVKGLPGLKITTQTEVAVDAAQARWVVLSAEIPYGSAESGSHKIQFEVQSVGSDDFVIEKSVFIVPR
jgi:hypothetical protein